LQTSGSLDFDASGLVNRDGGLNAADSDATGGYQVSGFEADFDVVARNRSVGRFARIDAHIFGDHDGCPYWGVTQVAQ
jgi:hypothetical protein